MSIELERMGWENLPSKKTALSKINLEKMEQNIENAINEVDEKKVEITNKATQEESERGINNEKYMTPKSTKQAINKALEEYEPSSESIEGYSTPIGAIFIYASNTIPSKWLLCSGQELNRTEYSELFNIIGTIYGEGNGSTTFNLPNLKGRVPVGKDDNDYDFDILGKTGGEKEHTLTINEMPNHNHKIGVDNNTFGAGSYPNNRALEGTGLTTSSTGGGQAHNNLQPYIILNYIIKAK